MAQSNLVVNQEIHCLMSHQLPSDMQIKACLLSCQRRVSHPIDAMLLAFLHATSLQYAIRCHVIALTLEQ